VPRDFDPAKRWPLVVSLHGRDSNHRLNLRRVFGKGNLPGQTNAEASRRFPPLPEVEFLVASPLARGSIGYQGLGGRDVEDMIADVRKRFPVDEDRMYLTGLTMGAAGALSMAFSRPDRWAAAAAITPEEVTVTPELWRNAMLLPIRLYHGALDVLMKPEATRTLHKQLLDAEVPVEYFELAGSRHNAWDHAYANAAIFPWFARYRRNRYPDRVRHAATHYRNSRSYWVEIDRMVPGKIASINARFTAANQIEVATEGVDHFNLHLEGHPQYRKDKPLRVTHNGRTWRASKPAPFPFRAKKPGSEGPIGAAFAARHLYVYGTADDPPPEEREQRRAHAQSALDAFRKGVQGPLQVRVVADRDLAPDEAYTTYLILFGTRQTNRWINVWADRLPMHLNPGAADYGMMYVADAGLANVVVISGRPWWTGGHVHEFLARLGDYFVFRGSPDNILAEGYFDNTWNLPKDAEAKLRQAGAVAIQRIYP
jgi:hypothetical protein